jgi:DNA-binding transcriptional ArsR family regulator
MRISKNRANAKRVSRPLQRLLRELYRSEPLEQRILLSADPVAAIVQFPAADRIPDRDFGADSALTVISWETVAGKSSVEAPSPGSAAELAMDGAAFDPAAAAVGAERSNVSRHLAVMARSGIVRTRREGLKVYYSLRTPCILDFMACATRTLEHDLEERTRALADA